MKREKLRLLLVLMIFLVMPACGNAKNEKKKNVEESLEQAQTKEQETDSANQKFSDTDKKGNNTAREETKLEQETSDDKTQDNISGDTTNEKSNDIIEPSTGDSTNRNNEKEWLDVNADPDGWT